MTSVFLTFYYYENVNFSAKCSLWVKKNKWAFYGKEINGPIFQNLHIFLGIHNLDFPFNFEMFFFFFIFELIEQGRVSGNFPCQFNLITIKLVQEGVLVDLLQLYHAVFWHCPFLSPIFIPVFSVESLWYFLYDFFK